MCQNASNILSLIEQKYSMSVQLSFKGAAEPMRDTKLSVRLIVSRHCVVCSMGFSLSYEQTAPFLFHFNEVRHTLHRKLEPSLIFKQKRLVTEQFSEKKYHKYKSDLFNRGKVDIHEYVSSIKE